MRKSRTPAGFCARAIAKPKRRFWNPLKRKKYSAQKRKKYSAHTIRNRSQKSTETLFLEPTKNKACPSHCETSATRQSETSATRQSLRKLRRERIRKGRAPAGFVPKPLRNRSRKNAETSLLEPTKNKQKTKKKQRNSALATRTSHCETASRKNAETSLLEPIKKKERPSRFCVQAIAELQPQKSRNVAFGTPKNNGIVPQPLRNFSHQAKRNFSHQAKPKKAASGAHPKKQSPSRFCAEAIAKPQPEKCRNVAFGTH